MKRLSTIFILGLLVLFSVLSSVLSGCKHFKCGDDPISIKYATIDLVYLDRSGNRMLEYPYQKYKLDDIYILLSDSISFDSFSAIGSGRISIRYYSSNDNLSYEFLQNKTYLIHLPHVGSDYVEVDTLRLTYQYAKGYCTNTEVQNMTVYFNGEILDEGGNGVYSRAFFITKL